VCSGLCRSWSSSTTNVVVCSGLCRSWSSSTTNVVVCCGLCRLWSSSTTNVVVCPGLCRSWSSSTTNVVVCCGLCRSWSSSTTMQTSRTLIAQSLPTLVFQSTVRSSSILHADMKFGVTSPTCSYTGGMYVQG